MKLNLLLVGVSIVCFGLFLMNHQFQRAKWTQLERTTESDALSQFRSLLELDQNQLRHETEGSAQAFGSSIQKLDLARRLFHDQYASPAKRAGATQASLVTSGGKVVASATLLKHRRTISRHTLARLIVQAQTEKHSTVAFVAWDRETPFFVCASPILSSDAKTVPSTHVAYFVSVMALDDAYCARLGRLTGSSVVMRSPNELVPALQRESAYEFTFELQGFDGKRAAHMAVIGDTEFAELSRRETAASLAFLLGLLTVVWVSTRIFIDRWAIRPLLMLSESVTSESVVPIEKYLIESSEVGELARSIRESLVQKSELERLNHQFSELNVELTSMNDALEALVSERTAELQQAVEETIIGWSKALEARDKETEGHTQRVAELSVQLARQIKLSESEVQSVYFGAILHDIGKLGIPDHILLKEGELSDWEYEKMKTHTVVAYEMLRHIEFLKDSLVIPMFHHEKWDGSGYPTGLSGVQIPLAARLFAIADVWDALRSFRPYRVPWSEEKTRNYIKSQAGSHFDPDLVEVFLQLPPLEHPSDWFVAHDVSEEEAA